MSRFGVPRDVRQRVLNHGDHRKGNITVEVCSQYDYGAGKRAALELWADALEHLIEDKSGRIEGFHARLLRLKQSEMVEVR